MPGLEEGMLISANSTAGAVASQAGVALAQLLEELGEKAFPLPLHELRVILPGRGPVFVDSSG